MFAYYNTVARAEAFADDTVAAAEYLASMSIAPIQGQADRDRAAKEAAFDQQATGRDNAWADQSAAADAQSGVEKAQADADFAVARAAAQRKYQIAYAEAQADMAATDHANTEPYYLAISAAEATRTDDLRPSISCKPLWTSNTLAVNAIWPSSMPATAPRPQCSWPRPADDIARR